MEVPSKLPIFDAAHFLTMKGSLGIIGIGGYGQIRLCQNLKSEQVAVKYFAVTGSRDQIEDKLKKIESEGKILHKLSHPNIIKVFGITEWNKYVGIITEYMPGGNLDGFLNNIKLPDIPWGLRLRMALQIAEAIKYLHHNRPKKQLIHGDIKPDNMLLDDKLNVKLADFGSINLKLNTGASATTTKIPLNKQHTLYYTAPEFLKDPTKLRTTQMDVYSFGVVLYEFVTRSRSYENTTAHLSVLLQVIVDRGQRPDQSRFDAIQSSLSSDDVDIFNVFVELMRKCWSQQPSDRPDMKIVCDNFRSIFNEKDEDTIEQQTRDIIYQFRKKEMEFDTKEAIPLNSISSDSGDVIHSLSEFTTEQKTSEVANVSRYSTSAISVDNTLETSSEDTEIRKKKQKLLEQIKRRPKRRKLINICREVMEIADDDFTSKVASHFPAMAWFFKTSLTIEDVRAISFVMKKINKKIERLDLVECQLTSEMFRFIVDAFKEMRGSVDLLNISDNYLSPDDIDGINVMLDKVNKLMEMLICFDDGKGGTRDASETEIMKLQRKLDSMENWDLEVFIDSEGTVLSKN